MDDNLGELIFISLKVKNLDEVGVGNNSNFLLNYARGTHSHSRKIMLANAVGPFLDVFGIPFCIVSDVGGFLRGVPVTIF